MKYSRKREKIIKLFEDGSLLTASEVCERLSQIDRATIYRNLDLFTKNKILRKVNVKDGVSSYELAQNGDYHQHFICTRCKKIMPIEIDLSSLKQIIPKNIKFEEFELNLKGMCNRCE